MNILIYIDTDPSSGAGHLHRSVNLGLEFYNRGCNISLIATKGFHSYINHINSSKFKLLTKLSTKNYDLLVVDNYSFKNENYKYLRQYADKLLVLDDLCNRKIDCDFLWDPTITHKLCDYHNFVPENCKVFIGGKYQIFSEAHINYAKYIKRKNLHSYNQIHLYAGCSKISNLIEIEKYFVKNKIPTMYLGSKNKAYRHTDLNTAQEFSSNPIETYAKSKLGVGSPGNMLWERGSIGLPSYVLINNQNQISICEELMDADLLYMGAKNWCDNQSNEAENIMDFFNQSSRLKTISKNLIEKISLTGKKRLVSEILTEYDFP
jgi:UDP-2,4-diacetamido-2,4,6-trideoxy-beta-L-altropyranose hydrolase